MGPKGSEREVRRPRAAALLETVAREAVALCDATRAVERACAAGKERLLVGGHALTLRPGGRLIIVAYGKAAPRMLAGFQSRMREAGGRRTVRGLLIAPRPADRAARAKPGRFIEVIIGDHPVPLKGSFAAGRRALALLARATPKDDVVFLASGGGSALMAAPLLPFVTAAEKSRLSRYLVVSGAPIGAINAVRKHLSAVKGGRLAAAARKARSQTTLVLCDVDPERFDEVASGPSLPDRTTLDDLVQVVDRYGAAPLMPARALDALRLGRLPETPKPKAPPFRRSRSVAVLTNRDLRTAAVRLGLSYGLAAEAMHTELVGPVELAVEGVARAIEAAPGGTRLLAMGGEVLTIPQGGGVGGRAQEFALRLALRMSHLSTRPWAFLAFGSDGIDGNSPVSGAYVDGTTLARAAAARLDPGKVLKEADTHRLFRRLKDTFTVPAGLTTVRDLYLLLTGEAPSAQRRFTP